MESTASGRVVGALRGARALIEEGWATIISRRPEYERSEEFAQWLWRLFGKSIEWPRMVVCDWRHPEACEFSLCDAIAKAADDDALAMEVEEFLRPFVPGMSAMLWGESRDRTKNEILAMLDRAIARAERLAA